MWEPAAPGLVGVADFANDAAGLGSLDGDAPAAPAGPGEPAPKTALPRGALGGRPEPGPGEAAAETDAGLVIAAAERMPDTGSSGAGRASLCESRSEA